MSMANSIEARPPFLDHLLWEWCATQPPEYKLSRQGNKLLLRHASANHKRETIAFNKRRQGGLYRAAIWAVWRNVMKSRSENRGDDPPAVALGFIPRRLGVREVLVRRLFPWRQALGPWLERCYFARIPTRRLARCRSHTLRYAV